MLKRGCFVFQPYSYLARLLSDSLLLPITTWSIYKSPARTIKTACVRFSDINMAIIDTLRRGLAQSFNLPAPTLTEKNLPDQLGKVHIVTGGYAGVGEQLVDILYGANATVFVAGRSQEKADRSIAAAKAAHPDSKGTLTFLKLDLQDLPTIAPAVAEFNKASGGKLNVLTNNAGVMMPPAGTKSAQGYEVQIATNCLGGFLLTKLLLPTLKATAKAEGKEGAVRVTWAASLAVDLLSPKGGIAFGDGKNASPAGEPIPAPKVLGKNGDYGQSKAGNYYLAAAMAHRDGWGREEGIAHYVRLSSSRNATHPVR